MSALDFAVIAGFIIYSLASGLRARAQASQNLEEYFLAGRSVPGWKAGLSMAATQFAADTPLLVMGIIATAGIFGLWQLWIYGLSFLLIGHLLGPQWRRARLVTDAELSELRYAGGPALFLRGFKAVYFGTVFNCAVLAMVLLAATRIAEPFLPWEAWLPEPLFAAIRDLVEQSGLVLTLDRSDPVWALTKSTSNFISIGCIVAVTTTYSMTGGLRGVINTDVMQFFLMMGATAVYAVIAVSRAGGLGAVHEQIAVLAEQGRTALAASEITAFTPSRAYGVGLPLLAVFGLQWLIQMNSDGTGYLAQRIMACKSDRDARFATVVFTVAQVLLRSLLWVPLGLALLVLFPPTGDAGSELFKAEREMTFIRGMVEHLPVGALGIMLTGMLAALASTLDTHLNWGAAYWTNDLYKRLLCERVLKRNPNPRTLVWVARLSNLCILVLSVWAMKNLTSIQRAWQISLLLGAGMGIPLLLRWFWWRMNSWGEIAAIAVSAAGAPVALWLFTPEQTAHALLFMAGLSGLACVGACWVMGPEPEAVLRAFYERVKPVGFWGPYAEGGEGDGRRLFYQGLGSTLGMAFAIFSLLTGIGSALAGSEPPTWFPYTWAWRLGLVSLALVILWRRKFAARSIQV